MGVKCRDFLVRLVDVFRCVVGGFFPKKEFYQSRIIYLLSSAGVYIDRSHLFRSVKFLIGQGVHVLVKS